MKYYQELLSANSPFVMYKIAICSICIFLFLHKLSYIYECTMYIYICFICTLYIHKYILLIHTHSYVRFTHSICMLRLLLYVYTIIFVDVSKRPQKLICSRFQPKLTWPLVSKIWFIKPFWAESSENFRKLTNESRKSGSHWKHADVRPAENIFL